MAEALQDDPPLEIAVERHPEVVPHHERYEDRPRGLEVLGDVTRDRDGHRGDAASLYGALDQSDRLVADRSSRREQGEVGVFVSHSLREVLGERALK